MKFSILTPTFNAERYIGSSIESLVSQKYQDWENIIVDNFSTDKTEQIVKHYQKKFPNKIKFVRQKSDIGEALNIALSKASGDIIGWLDSDDIYLPNALNDVFKTFISNDKIRFVYGNTGIINQYDNMIGVFRVEKFNKELWINEWHHIVLSSTFYKKDIFNQISFLNKLGNDLEFYLRAAKITQLTYINKNLSSYRIHPTNVSNNQDSRSNLIRKNRAVEDLLLIVKYRGSLFSPKAFNCYGKILTYYKSHKLIVILASFMPIFIKAYFRKAIYKLTFISQQGKQYNETYFINLIKNLIK